MSLTWEAITGIAILTSAIAGLFWLLIIMAINNSLDKMRIDLIRELNGTYIRRGECGLIRNEMERRLDRLEGQES